ncbi:uncharacterized protein LOC127877010 isoform X2 [Dreissena polymorpha]|uniref:Uncharacterized protein n=1 Tax=Dreissena polymorpha TaxID=45954 RepID=A0A9D4K384_DREPO|nr:uncharacterized protein LOC127877010 isoform X2 [Dreissena polymorpha]KAH3831993.1 hypothetical protein DPMN_105267 [Dreissena polymorpha]
MISNDVVLVFTQRPARMQFPGHLTYKIVLLGDQCVGKSSLLNRFIKGSYCPHYIQTHGAEFFLKDMEVESNPVRLVLYDSMGQSNMKTIVRSIYRDAMGVMLVFDFNRADTLQRVKEWLQLIEQNCEIKPEKILVGNKMDLDEDMKKLTNKEVTEVTKSLELDFIEVSAKTGYKVEEAFVTLVNKIFTNRERLRRDNMITSIRLTDKQVRKHDKQDCCD